MFDDCRLTDCPALTLASNLPKAATRTRKNKISNFEDEDYVSVEDEATSKKKVLKKEYGTSAPQSQECKRRHLQGEFPLPNLGRLPLVTP